MMKITRKQLDSKAAFFNKLLNQPAEYMNQGAINIGHYHISGSYGGYCLHQTMNDSGGINDVFNCGHVPARDLIQLMSAFIIGYEEAAK